jgi:hypothetical protein
MSVDIDKVASRGDSDDEAPARDRERLPCGGANLNRQFQRGCCLLLPIASSAPRTISLLKRHSRA